MSGQHALSPRLPLALMLGATALVTGHSLHFLYLRWLSLDRAVFEADVYAQGIARAVHLGSFWPWDLTQEFWPFVTMAPGIYLFIPLFALFKGGYATLVSQALGLGLSSLLVYALARRKAPASTWAPLALGLAWLLHPLIGVGMGWGWSFYTFGAPLALAGALALDKGRWGWAALWLILAASMKVNVALGIAGYGLWGMFQKDRPWGTAVLIASGAWIALTGTFFLTGLLAEGRLSHDLHLGEAQAAVATAGGLVTVALTVVPLAPLLRRAWMLALLAAGLELAYTLLVNPANSGLIPATAFIFIAACEGLAHAPRPERNAGAALALALVAHFLFNPPIVGPLPLTPAALTYEVDPRGRAVRAFVDALGADETLVVNEPMMGAIGRHRGPVLRAQQWDGRPAAMVYQGAFPPVGAEGCLSALAGSGVDTVRAGRCR